MKKFWLVCLALVSSAIFAALALAQGGITVNRLQVEEFAALPEGARYPEGITANPATGQIYVGTLDFEGNNQLLRFAQDGTLEAQKVFTGPLTGLIFQPGESEDEAGQVYVANFGFGKIQRIPADFTDDTPDEEVVDVATLPSIGPPPARLVANPDGSTDVISFTTQLTTTVAAPNALTFNSEGDLFISDSFQGAIFRINDVANCEAPCEVETVTQDALLATAGFPPFGANGLAFSDDGSQLFVANTGDDRILQMNILTDVITVTVFAESINGADGITFDDQGRLWVAANQNDELVALNSAGRVVARYGDFLGINADGAAQGLLFPASPVIVDNQIFVTNLALPLTPQAGDEPEEDVTRFTIAVVDISGG
ncbi:MAG: SMP-30/gluconolactonase/LRE family protein [Anaerolineae bacterium]|nr:SMP-30/gluconolactonase/LRE family protein [Anaerolineae bacterium]